MEFQDVVDKRRMIRNYADRPVDPAVVERALRNATRAPSAGFSQGWGFLVLDTPEDVRRWWETTTDPGSLAAPDRWLTGMMRAPVVIVPCSSKAAYLDRYAQEDKAGLRRLAPLRAVVAEQAPRPRNPTSVWTDRDEARWPVPFWHMDAAMASLLILQTAVDEGLGACFFGIPVEKADAVRAAFAIDPAFDPVGVITLGHRVEDSGNAGSPARRARRPLGEVVHRGRWS